MHTKIKYIVGFGITLVASGLSAATAAQEAPALSVVEQRALKEYEIQNLKKVMSLKQRLAATFKGAKAKNEQARHLAELMEEEWVLREQLLKQQGKNRLQLFINKHKTLLKTLAIALAATATVGGAAYMVRRANTARRPADGFTAQEAQKAAGEVLAAKNAKKDARRGAAAAAGAGGAGGGVSVAELEGLTEDLNDARRARAGLEQRLDALQREHNALKERASAAFADIAQNPLALRAKLARANEEVIGLRQKLKDIAESGGGGDTEDLRAERAALRAEAAQAKQAVERLRQVREAFNNLERQAETVEGVLPQIQALQRDQSSSAVDSIVGNLTTVQKQLKKIAQAGVQAIK